MPKCGSCNLESPSLLRCGQCLEIAYCNRSCQVAHWKSVHKKECQPLVKEQSCHLKTTRNNEKHLLEEQSCHLKTTNVRNVDKFDEDYLVEFQRDFTKLKEKIVDHGSTLQSQGYLVVDDFIGYAWSSALLQEMKWLNKKNLMLPNKTQFATQDGQQVQFTKPHIFEIDLHNSDLRERVPELNAWFWSTALEEILCECVPGIHLTKTVNGHTLKLQRNSGNGGCFPFHYDNPGHPNKRQLTCILYLNPLWQPGDGGELQLLPFLGQKVTIPPLMDRLVIFYSDRILHRVLESHAERYCLTIWMDGLDVNKDQFLKKYDPLQWQNYLSYLKTSPLQRLLSRGVYQEEYQNSLWECMKGATGYLEMQKSHQHHLQQIQKNPPLYELIQKLKEEKGKHH